MKKISELTTDNGLDVLVEITPYIEGIVSCENLHKKLEQIAQTSRKDIKSRFQEIVYGAGTISKLIPILLKERREDVYGILSVLNELPVQEIAQQPLVRTISDIREIFKDKELVSFFNSFVDTAPVK